MYYDYGSLKEHKTYAFVKPILKILSHIVYSSECIGRENVPESGKLIIACNHIGTPDPAFIVANCPRRIHFMAKSDLFERRSLSCLFTLMNAFPVVRCSSDRKALRYALRVLSEGKVLGIFPEGRRVRQHESLVPTEALTGVGYLARISGADVLPVCLYRKPGCSRFRPVIVVCFGKVISNDELGFKGENRSKEMKAASAKIMEEIRKLWLYADSVFSKEKQ